jgi:AcrR family transcriptional regulator
VTAVTPRGGDPPVTKVRRRRHGSELEEAVFEATLQELGDVGFVGLTMDSVASAAGTGKAALYRRWSNKSELVLDALRNALPSPTELKPGASLREDLIALLSCIQEASALAHSSVFRAAAIEGNRECRQLLDERVLQPCRNGVRDAFRRARRRGEINARTVDPLLVSLGQAMLVDHILAGDGQVSDAFVASVVDRLLLPLATHEAPSQRSRRR